MLPEKRKNLIFMIIAVIGVIIVIIVMYNLAKYMRNRGVDTTVYDDPYPEVYPYYGVYYDEENTYKLAGINGSFNETDLGLLIFYPINNLYWRNNHLAFYSDATNELRYNSNDEVYTLYELDTFYSNNVDVFISGDILVMLEDNRLSHRTIGGEEASEISNNLVSDKVLCLNDKVYYVINEGIYEYDLSTGSTKLIMIRGSNNEQELLAINDEYLVFRNDNNYYFYEFDSGRTNEVNLELENATFVALVDVYFIYQYEDESGHTLGTYSLEIRQDIRRNFNLGWEEVTHAYYLSGNYIYAELEDVDDGSIRYVVIDVQNTRVVKELENRYRTIIEVTEND